MKHNETTPKSQNSSEPSPPQETPKFLDDAISLAPTHYTTTTLGRHFDTNSSGTLGSILSRPLKKEQS